MAVLKRLRMETVLGQPSAAQESPVRLLSTGKSHSPKPSASPWGSLGRKTRLLKISTLNPASRAKRVINSDSEEVSGCPWISGMCNTRKSVPLGKLLVLEWTIELFNVLKLKEKSRFSNRNWQHMYGSLFWPWNK